MPVLRRRERLDPERRSAALDVVLALGLTALLQRDVWFGDAEGEVFEVKPLSAVLMLLLTVPLIWRRRAPLAVAGAYGLGRAAQALVTGSWVASPGILLATLVALYSVGAHGKGARAWLGMCFVVGGLLVATAYDIPSTESDLWNGLFFYVLCLLVFAAGLYVRGRRRSTELEVRAAQIERDRLSESQAIAEERARIARELHDIVAHSVSATVVQAEAADEVLTQSPERARESLARIQHTGREALGEMRLLLGIMRGDGQDQSLRPQPRVADLERLIDEAGATSTLRIEGAPRELPPGVDLSAYRVVQEALTNVRRHAGRSARATVVVRYGDTVLELEITDDGGGPNDSGRHGDGLIGMRERVAFFGGEFDAGAGPTGGFLVRASFPLAPVEP